MLNGIADNPWLCRKKHPYSVWTGSDFSEFDSAWSSLGSAACRCTDLKAVVRDDSTSNTYNWQDCQSLADRQRRSL